LQRRLSHLDTKAWSHCIYIRILSSSRSPTIYWRREYGG